MSPEERPNPAEMYQQFFVPAIHSRWAPRLLSHARPRPGERVLDVACGTGIVARTVAPLVGPDGTVIAVDISPDMLAVARSLPAPAGTIIDWREGDAASLPVPDGTIDLVLCQQGLQFFPDRATTVREMRRVLAPSGRAAVSVFRGLDHHPLYAALFEAEGRHLDTPAEELATPFSFDDADALRELFADAGFQRVEIQRATHEVVFPSPDRFVAFTVLAGASFIPEAEMDAEARTELVDAIAREVAPVLRSYTIDDNVVFPMHAHVAVAHLERDQDRPGSAG